MSFGVANLARESLWTVVSREEKFKAKNIIDGAVFRGADAINAQIFNGLAALMKVPAVAIVGAGVAVGLGSAVAGPAARRRKSAPARQLV
ncbi:MAG: hypothetical protein WDO12_01120 [Pseudomonadota bacterium]